MVRVAFLVLLIFGLNMWLALSTLFAVSTGVARINGREYRKQEEMY
jgi:hypothetical protein